MAFSSAWASVTVWWARRWALRSRQTGSMALSSGAYFGSRSTVSQCARAERAARESLLVWIGPLSSMVRHRFLEQGGGHAQGGFTHHRRRARRDPRLQRRDAASGEVAAPQADRILAHAERLRDLGAGPPRKRQKHGARTVRLAAIARTGESRQSIALFIIRRNRRFPRHAAHPANRWRQRIAKILSVS